MEGKLECVGENETWVETEGEGCYTKQCVRHVDNKTGQITFEVETILKGKQPLDYFHTPDVITVLNCIVLHILFFFFLLFLF